MKKALTCICALCFILGGTLTVYSQELPQAQKLENQSWHQVVLVNFKPGTTNQAMNIIHNHFEKAGQKIGLPGPSLMMEMKSGDWDLMLVWNMNDIAEMNWSVTPEDESWWKQLAKQEGGADKAMTLWEEYMGYIDNSTSYLATSRN